MLYHNNHKGKVFNSYNQTKGNYNWRFYKYVVTNTKPERQQRAAITVKDGDQQVTPT
jgi:hypothetical protein